MFSIFLVYFLRFSCSNEQIYSTPRYNNKEVPSPIQRNTNKSLQTILLEQQSYLENVIHPYYKKNRNLKPQQNLSYESPNPVIFGAYDTRPTKENASNTLALDLRKLPHAINDKNNTESSSSHIDSGYAEESCIPMLPDFLNLQNYEKSKKWIEMKLLKTNDCHEAINNIVNELLNAFDNTESIKELFRPMLKNFVKNIDTQINDKRPIINSTHSNLPTFDSFNDNNSAFTPQNSSYLVGLDNRSNAMPQNNTNSSSLQYYSNEDSETLTDLRNPSINLNHSNSNNFDFQTQIFEVKTDDTDQEQTEPLDLSFNGALSSLSWNTDTKGSTHQPQTLAPFPSSFSSNDYPNYDANTLTGYNTNNSDYLSNQLYQLAYFQNPSLFPHTLPGTRQPWTSYASSQQPHQNYFSKETDISKYNPLSAFSAQDAHFQTYENHTTNNSDFGHFPERNTPFYEHSERFCTAPESNRNE